MKYAFLGAGKMALAMIQGMLRSKVCSASEITASCPEPELLSQVHAATSVNVVTSNAEALSEASVAILCVKPNDVATALAQAGSALEGKLLISIVAGLKIESLQSLARGARVIRAMPNTAAMVGKSASAYASDKAVTAEDRAIAEGVFTSIGGAYPVDEKLLDAVTGLSGSGPAYVYLMIEALSDGGVACGLPRKLALDLAVQTVVGAAEMLAATGEHPAVLREMVTSPAGTTMAGLRELENRGVRSAFIEAVRAASNRAGELSGS
jgi:pyrroline-5-carboxylate reductase